MNDHPPLPRRSSKNFLKSFDFILKLILYIFPIHNFLFPLKQIVTAKKRMFWVNFWILLGTRGKSRISFQRNTILYANIWTKLILDCPFGVVIQIHTNFMKHEPPFILQIILIEPKLRVKPSFLYIKFRLILLYLNYNIKKIQKALKLLFTTNSLYMGHYLKIY